MKLQPMLRLRCLPQGGPPATPQGDLPQLLQPVVPLAPLAGDLPRPGAGQMLRGGRTATLLLAAARLESVAFALHLRCP